MSDLKKLINLFVTFNAAEKGDLRTDSMSAVPEDSTLPLIDLWQELSFYDLLFPYL